MRQYRSLAVLLVLVLGGCLSAGGAGTADGHTPTETPRPLPDRPDSLTNESAKEFVVAYERAHAWNAIRNPNTTDLTLNAVTTRVNESGDGYRVHVEMGLSHYQRVDGGKTVGDGYYTAVYFVNDSALLRAQAGGEVRPGPDPRNGTVLEVGDGE